MASRPLRPWRTNVGLRLTAEVGAWLEAYCERENRTYANFVETLIMRERDRAKIAQASGGTPDGR